MVNGAGKMTFGNGEDRVAFAIEQLMQPDEAWRGVVRDMVARWPDVPPQEIGLALVTAAAAIEGSFTETSPAQDAARHGYRLAALLGMDIYAMELLQMPRAEARDLQAYWQIDPFFTRL